MKYMDAGWEKLYLSQEMEASMSPSVLSSTLKSIGKDWESQRKFFRGLMKKGDTLLFDLSSIFSSGENVLLAEKRYNRHHLNLREINFAMAFSRSDFILTILKPLPGSVRDVKSISSFLKEFDLSKSILILDKGFFSFRNVEFFIENDIEFIQPLSRALRIIDYSIPLDSFLTYRERGIRYSRVDVTEKFKNITIEKGKTVFLYMYEDVKLRGEEESNLIFLLRNRKIKKYDITKLGKISILSNMEMDGETIYNIYKGWEDAEQLFDGMWNELEEDKTYLQDDESIWGYFFITFLSLYQHYRVLALIRSKDLVGKLSVNEVLLQLSGVYMVKYTDGTTGSLGIPNEVENIIEALDLNILPKS
jgi:transposase